MRRTVAGKAWSVERANLTLSELCALRGEILQKNTARAKRATRLERATFSLEGCAVPTEVTQSQALTNAAAAACTNACTNSADSTRRGDPCRLEIDAAATFAEAVTMLARLPLTDAERAEAVRRMLAEAGGAKTGIQDPAQD